MAKDESFASHEYDLACQVEIDTSFDTTVDTVSDFETCALDLSYPDPDGSSLIEPSMNDEYHSLSIDTLSNHF